MSESAPESPPEWLLCRLTRYQLFWFKLNSHRAAGLFGSSLGWRPINISLDELESIDEARGLKTPVSIGFTQFHHDCPTLEEARRWLLENIGAVNAGVGGRSWSVYERWGVPYPYR